MPTHLSADAARNLARMMIRQSRMLRDEGLLFEARELARRAMKLSRLAWSGRFTEISAGA